MRRSSLIAIAGTVLVVAGMAFPPGSRAQDFSESYEQALVAYTAGEIRTAYIHLKNALQEDPMLLSAHLLLAKIHLAMGNGAEAEQELSIADRLGADRSLIVVPLARSYLQQGKPQKLLDELFPGGKTPEEDAELLSLRGEAHLDRGDLFDAERAFDQAWQRAPYSVPALLGRVQARLLRGALPEALEDAVRAVEAAPDDPEAWYYKALIERDLGEPEKALKGFERAVEAEPAHLPAQIARVGVLVDLARIDEAAAVIEQLRGLYPRDPRTLYMAAVVAHEQGDPPRAEAALIEAEALMNALDRSLVEGHSPTLLLAGLINFSLKKWDRASEFLGPYLRRHPDEIGPTKLYARILLARSQTEAAINILETALNHAPEDPLLLSLAAEAYMSEGDHLRAAGLLDRALSADSGDVSVRAKRAINSFLLGHRAQAIDELGAVFSSWPDLDSAGSSLVVMLIQKHNFARAAEVADEIVARHPDDIALLHLQGVAHYSAGDSAKAREGFERALALDSSFLPAHVNLAMIDRREGRLEESRARLEKVLQEQPGQVVAMVELARTFEALGQREEAQKWAEAALETDPHATDAAIFLSDLLVAGKELDKALAVIGTMEVRARGNTEVLIAVSRVYLAAGQRSTAQAVLQRATSAAGYDARSLMQIAMLQQEAGDLGGAAWALRKAVDGEPDYLPARIRLGELLSALGRFEKAELVATDLQRDHPQRPYGYHLMATVQQRSGKPEKALENLRIALSYEKSPILAVRVYEAMRTVEGEGAAMAFLVEWVEDHPKDAIARQTLAEAYFRGGRWEDAKALYEVSLEEAPESPLLLNNLAMIYERTGDPRALEYARRAYAMLPSAPQIGDTLGWILVRTGDRMEGLKHLRDAQSRAAGDPGIAYHIAVALDGLGRPKEAMRELRKALRSRSDFPDRKDAEAMLGRLSDPAGG